MDSKTNKNWFKKNATEYIFQPLEMEFVLIPSGVYWMGSPESDEEAGDWEKPQRRVSVEAFLLGKYLVKQKQWQMVVEGNPSDIKGENLPVNRVSWVDCQCFLEKVNEMYGEEFGLPKEYQWEYACRGGTTTRYYWGDEMEERPTTKRANGFGLYDLGGRIDMPLDEWCEDSYAEYHELGDKVFYRGKPNEMKVARGYSFDEFTASPYRSAGRMHDFPRFSCDPHGFRFSRSVF